jgi:hypothetical protein
MDARPLALAAGVALAAWLFVLLQRDLARLGASSEARGVAAAAYLAMGAAWGAVLVASAPTWLAWLGTVAAFVVTVAPRALLRLPRLVNRGASDTGAGIGRLTFLHRRAPESELVSEIGRIRMAMSTLTTSSYERAQLRANVRQLEKWRGSDDPRARELVLLMQEAVFQRLDGDRLDAESLDAESLAEGAYTAELDPDRPHDLRRDAARERPQRPRAHAGDPRQRERRIRELLRELGE